MVTAEQKVPALRRVTDMEPSEMFNTTPLGLADILYRGQTGTLTATALSL